MLHGFPTMTLNEPMNVTTKSTSIVEKLYPYERGTFSTVSGETTLYPRRTNMPTFTVVIVSDHFIIPFYAFTGTEDEALQDAKEIAQTSGLVNPVFVVKKGLVE